MHLTVPLSSKLTFSPRAGLLVLLLACACQTRRTVALAPDRSGELPKRSVLVKNGGERVRLEEGRLSGDSVIGVRRNGERISIHRDSVALEESRVNPKAVIAVTALSLAGLFGFMVFLYSHDSAR